MSTDKKSRWLFVIPVAVAIIVAITLGAVLSQWTLFGRKELANPKFRIRQ
jgi:ABC-type sugar transport system permease subunit